MEKSSPWKNYYEGTREKPPRESLVDAIKLAQGRDVALDLGGGALRDSKYLLKNGFKKVIVVDKEQVVADLVHDQKDDRLESVTSTFEAFDFQPNSYDVVNAQFSLPFTRPDKFQDMFRRLEDSLKKGGIFVGQFFGDHDSWKSNSNMTFLMREQIEELLNQLQVLELREEEKYDEADNAEERHWRHIFHVTARK